MQGSYYITTSIPYVNAKPHIGHALELVQADALARYYRLAGADVFFQTGTDENAQKNVSAARKLGIPVRRLVDENSGRFADLATRLETAPDSFIRTTEKRHAQAVERFWSSLDERDLTRRSYRGLYCQGCEDFLSDRDLVDGVCPDHSAPPVEIEESNYFFRLSRYQDRIERLIESEEIRIYPESRKREVLAFVRAGLHDISVSRDARRMSSWGIPVPGDPSQVVYVWIDALINYISGIGYGDCVQWNGLWNDRIRKTHIIGKNVWKFHAVYWPALLLSAGLPLPDAILVHGFLTVEGRKISKSLGNAVDPMDEAEVLGADALRLFLLSLSTFGDSDYSRDGLVRFYNSQVAARLGSTVTRVTALCERMGVPGVSLEDRPLAPDAFHAELERARLDHALDELLQLLDAVNRQIAREKPWESDSTHTAMRKHVERWVAAVHTVGYWLRAFAPTLGAKVCAVVTERPIRKPKTLFPKAAAV